MEMEPVASVSCQCVGKCAEESVFRRNQKLNNSWQFMWKVTKKKTFAHLSWKKKAIEKTGKFEDICILLLRY